MPNITLEDLIMFDLFIIFFRVGLFTFGGGYAMIPIMERELVTKKNLLSKDDFVDYISAAQSLPGPIAVNLSVLLGYDIIGFSGALIALLGTVLPSLIVIIAVSVFYTQTRDSKVVSGFFSGVTPVVPALLGASFLSLFQKIEKKPFNIFLMAISFTAVALFDINPIWMIAGGVTIGLCIYYLNSSQRFSK